MKYGRIYYNHNDVMALLMSKLSNFLFGSFTVRSSDISFLKREEHEQCVRLFFDNIGQYGYGKTVSVYVYQILTTQ